MQINAHWLLLSLQLTTKYDAFCVLDVQIAAEVASLRKKNEKN